MGVSVEVVLLGFVLAHGRQAEEADGWVIDHHRVTGGKETGVQRCLWMDLLDVVNVLGCLALWRVGRVFGFMMITEAAWVTD